ncbi:aldehyde dehydrogenase family protein [Candidatus Margulisiibacteriota bacterium]
MTNLDDLILNASSAAAVFSQLDQFQTDKIVKAVYEAAFKNRVRLAKLAYEETGIGKWEDKTIKNVLATQFVYNDIKDLKSVGVISEDEESGITEIAQPLGPIFAVIPCTNPTSTVIFKILIALKTRNPIIISPHNRSAKCSSEAAKICYEAAIKANAPDYCIQWMKESSKEKTQAIMSNKSIALILATGGGGLVKAAYSSGTPAIGVGAGNVPVYIEKTADIPFAVEQIIMSKTFDNGTVCASEQALVVEKNIETKVIEEFKKRNAYFLTEDEIKKIEAIAIDKERGVMNAEIVGQSAQVIAEKAGIKIPDGTALLVASLKTVGKESPLSGEILAPVLAFYSTEGFDQAVNLCIDLNFFGGIGHTVSIFSNDDEKIRKFSLLMNAGRIVVNTPSSQGAVGGLFNKLSPSLTLGCGSGGKNITTDNISAKHLLNIQRIARRRVNTRLDKFDTKLYFDESLDAKSIEKAYNKNY